MDMLTDDDNDILFADGFEDALVGIGMQFNRSVTVYDFEKCVEILMERDGMTDEDAREFMEFNVIGAYVGEHTPVFITERLNGNKKTNR